MVFLEFERPLENLYEQLEKIQQIDAEGDIDVSESIKELENKIKTKKKEIYSNLTGWQKVQLSRHPERRTPLVRRWVGRAVDYGGV